MKPWLIAFKPGSLPKILLPLFAGFSIGVWMGAEISVVNISLLFLYGYFLQIFIVVMNDVADVRADSYHMKHHPDLIDERMIPSGKISRKAMFGAGMAAAFFCFLIALVYTVFLGRVFASVAVFISLIMLILYSFGPARFNYIGMGELLEAFGVGVVLPITALYLTLGMFTPYDSMPVIIMFLLALASALSGGLKHMPSDKETGKKTFAVLFGIHHTKKMILLFVLLSLSAGILLLINNFVWIAFPMVLLFPLYHLYFMIQSFQKADISNLKALALFKKHLHRLIFIMISGLALTYLAQHFIS